MESLLRAVLTSSDNLGTFSNSSQSKRDIKLANPHLHAALTSTQLKPRPAMKLTKSAVEQPPGETACDKRLRQPDQKAPSRHSKLLEALISGVNHPTDDNNSHSSLNPDSNGFKKDKNSKPEALHKSRLFMALTSPMVSLDNLSSQNTHNLISQPDNGPAKGKANGIDPQDVLIHLQSASQNIAGHDNTNLMSIKSEQVTNDEFTIVKSNNLLDKSQTAFNSSSNCFTVDSQTPASVENCSSYKKVLSANTTMVHIKSEPQSEIVGNTDLTWENTQDQMVCNNKIEYKMEADEPFNGGVDNGESRNSNNSNSSNSLSECLTFKKECHDEASMECTFVCDLQIKAEFGNSCSTTSDYFSSNSAMGANISKKSPKPSAADHRPEVESSNLCTILQSTHKRKKNNPTHSSSLINKDDRISMVPCKKKKMLIEKNSKLLSVDNAHIDLLETDLDSPTPNREAGIFQKKSNTDAQILRRVLTEGICELRGSSNSEQSVASFPKSFAQIKDKHSAANLHLPFGTHFKPSVNQQEKTPMKSQILRAALTSMEPIVPLRKPNSESHSPPLMKISPTALKTETSSDLNAIPPLCSNPPDNTDSSGASAIKNSGKKISSVFGNSNGQDSIQTAVVEDRPQKTKCQLLLAALTASDNSKKSNLLNANESAPKQTSSEILRAALNNAEKDSQGIGAKHSQLLRAALTAVDTNKASKSWHQTNTKLTNSRLLRAVLTGKYIPDTVDYTDYSKVAHRKGPMSCNLSESKNDFSVSNTKMGTVTRSYDIVEITPNLSGGGSAAAAKKDKVQKVSPSINCNTRSSGHSILRAVLTGAIDIPHCTHESTKNNSVKHPELEANTNENHKESEVVSSCYSTIQDKKMKSNNINQTQPLSSSSSSSSSSSLSESGCKEQCCQYCGKYHSRSDSLWEYTSLFAGDTPHSCYMCNKSFNVTCLYLDHMATHTDISSKYKCEFCGRHFKHVLSYIMCRLSHIDAQKAEKVSCNLCNCEFTCRNKLKQHTQMHAKDSFTCKFCGKEFHRRVNCYLHEHNHMDKMNFTCKMCGEKFTRASDLKAHNQTHYTSELFKCSRCIKCFVTQRALKLHEETHIPVTRQDAECKKLFVQSDDLEHHQGGSSREKRKVLCEDCGLICTSRYFLAKHKTNCGGTPYTDKKFQVDMVSHSLVTIKD